MSSPVAGTPSAGAVSSAEEAGIRRHLLVVDDDQRLLALLKKFLQDQGYAVTCASDAAEARQRLAAMAFDLIILDVMMPGEDGLSFMAALRGDGAAVPILLLTAMGETEDRVQGFERGADDYLVKPFEPRELRLRIDAILRRLGRESAPPRPARVQLGPWRYDVEAGTLSDGKTARRLSEREGALLSRLARAGGQPVDREALRQVAPEPLSARAVDVQVTRLRRKVEADPANPRYLQTVRGVGYVLLSDRGPPADSGGGGTGER